MLGYEGSMDGRYCIITDRSTLHKEWSTLSLLHINVLFFAVQCETANITMPSFSEVHHCKLVTIAIRKMF